MLYSFQWLLDYLSLEDLKKNNLSPKKIASELSLKFMEVENLHSLDFNFENIVVGQITKILPHPHADKLHITEVNIGKKKINIVCGAQNIKNNMFVPIALPGAILANNIIIEETEIRGIESKGMICSASELGLEPTSTGILDLGNKLKIGQKLSDAIDFDDQILEISILPNRPDCLSIIGLAREISAITDTKFSPPSFKIKETAKSKIDSMIDINVIDPIGCQRYCSRIITNIKNGESPLWLKRRLIACGFRPINTVVDITNYVMLEYGQPMHAFDYDLLIGQELNIRKAKKGERIDTLDGQKKVLTGDDLVITDQRRVLAIAGIIGGQDTGVLANTKNIILESANFSRDYINNSSRRLGITTESSLRFGKGLPLSLTTEALDRATYLIQKLCGGEIVRGTIDVRHKRLLTKQIDLDLKYLSDLLDLDIPKNSIKSILKSLEFEIQSIDNDSITVTVPPFRIDIEHQEDLIEEIGRIYGYDHITTKPLIMPTLIPKPETSRQIRTDFINYLYHQGWSEMYSYTFENEKDQQQIGLNPEESYVLENPLDQNQNLLRQNLFNGLMQKSINWQKYSPQTKLFEWGKVFSNTTKPHEQSRLGLIYSDQTPVKQSFYFLKQTITNLLTLGHLDSKKLITKKISDTDLKLSFLHPHNSIVFYFQNILLGYIGQIHPSVTANYKTNQQPIYSELYLDNFNKIYPQSIQFKAPSKFPISKFDASFLISQDIQVADLINLAQQISDENLINIELFDEYNSPELQDKKSISLRFFWQSTEKTLSDTEVNSAMQKIFDQFTDQFQAKLRDNK